GCRRELRVDAHGPRADHWHGLHRPGALGSPGDTAVKAFMAGISSPQEGRLGLHTHSAAVKKDSAGPALIGVNTAVAGQSRGAENLGRSDAEALSSSANWWPRPAPSSAMARSAKPAKTVPGWPAANRVRPPGLM